MMINQNKKITKVILFPGRLKNPREGSEMNSKKRIGNNSFKQKRRIKN